MKTVNNKRWEDTDWAKCHRRVFKLQKQVFDAENRGDNETVVKLQKRIANSFDAKLLAVRQVAQTSKGRKAAGIDGIKNPTDTQKLRMAIELEIHHRPSSVRRVWIPKPGKDELRPLGIPNLIDRAHQALLVMVMEPQWETHFSQRQYGFRKGRGPHDATEFIRRHLRQAGPKWALEIDIEKFFDMIDHRELLRRLAAPPQIEAAVKKTLQAGGCVLGEHGPQDVGTPQGGPLSPLLANIALAGLEDHLERTFRRNYAGRITALGRPTLAIYADDAVVMHREREVVEWARGIIREYLVPLGLKLNEGKTRVTHTQEPLPTAAKAGFDFLGFHFQHHWTKKPGSKRVPYLLVTPSESAVKRCYQKCSERIDKLKLSRKQRGTRQYRQAQGKSDPVTVMIIDLNRMTRGWANYFCKCNAKQCFGKMDHLLHTKLWQWSTRRFERKKVQWVIDLLFSGVETDKDGKPLLRRDGNPRERQWAFKSPFVANDVPHRTLLKLADIPIQDHPLVQPHRSYYDGDWTYWQLRKKNRYPGTPPMLPLTAFRRQRGKCTICSQPILTGQRFAKGRKGNLETVGHTHCLPS
ncbi:MAG: RNA-directed DNA polymerase [Akkermansiaceae bacterium]|jgi:RNA-directed DNA polymerase